MADTKVVKVKWEAEFKELKALTKETRNYLSAVKDMSRTQQQAEKAAKLLAKRGFDEQAQIAQALAGQIKQLEMNTRQYAVTLAEQLAAQQQAITSTKEEEAAQKILNRALAETADEMKRLKDASQEHTKTIDINASSMLKYARTLVFWTVGAASTYRLVQKIRREFIDTVKAIAENTEEYKRLTKSADLLKAALAGLIGTQETWRKILDTIAVGVEAVGYAYAFFVSALRGMAAGALALFDNVRRAADRVNLAIAEFIGRQETIDLINARIAMMGKEVSVTDAIVKEFENTWKNIQDLWNTLGAGEADKGPEEAVDKFGKTTEKYEKYLEALIDAEERRIRSLIDLFEEYERKLQDIALETSRALDDLALAGARKREDIETAYLRKLEDIEAAQQDRRANAEEKYRIKLIQIEMRYRERLIQIEENFQDAMYDAISKRDATAALMAIRRRARDEGRAKRERDDARELARLNYEAQINDQERALERMREDARKARQRAYEDLKRDQERKRQDIKTDQERELDDLDTHFQRTQDDIEAQYQWEIDKAEAHYTQDEKKWTEHLESKLSEMQRVYRQMMNEHNLLMGVLSQPLPSPTVKPRTTTGPRTGANMAEGGAFIADRPTTVTVGEGRYAEAVMAVPIAPSASQVNYSGRLNHQISGQVGAALQGFEGRVGAIVTREVVKVMGEMLN